MPVITKFAELTISKNIKAHSGAPPSQFPQGRPAAGEGAFRQMAGQCQPVAPAGGKITLLQPAAAGADHRRAEQAQPGEAFEPNHQVQVLGPAVAKAAQGLEQLPLQDEDLVAIGQAQEVAAPVGRPGDASEGRQGRGES